jgi:hypothetical protein
MEWTGAKKRESRKFTAEMMDDLADRLCKPGNSGWGDSAVDMLVEEVRKILSKERPLVDVCPMIKYNKAVESYSERTMHAYAAESTKKILDVQVEMGDSPKRVWIEEAWIKDDWRPVKGNSKLDKVLFHEEDEDWLEDYVKIDWEKVIGDAISPLEGLLIMVGKRKKEIMTRLRTGKKQISLGDYVEGNAPVIKKKSKKKMAFVKPMNEKEVSSLMNFLG